MEKKPIRHGDVDQRGKRCGKLLFEVTPEGLEILCRCKKLVTVSYNTIMTAMSSLAVEPGLQTAFFVATGMFEEEGD